MLTSRKVGNVPNVRDVSTPEVLVPTTWWCVEEVMSHIAPCLRRRRNSSVSCRHRVRR